MTKEQETFKAKLEAAKKLHIQASSDYSNLMRSCKHSIVRNYDSSVCEICKQDFGWYCPDSQNHLCEYDENEECIHCGQPEERK